MNHTARIYYVNQSLLSSGLESSPARVEPKLFAPFRATGRTRNCINAPPWKKRPRPGCSNDSAGLPIRPRNWHGPRPIHYSSFRICSTRWLQRFESAFNRSKLATSRSCLSLWTLISDLKTFIPSPAGLIPFHPGGCLWPPYQNATRGNRAAGQTARLPHIGRGKLCNPTNMKVH